MQRVSNESPSNRRRISARARVIAPGAAASSLLLGQAVRAQDATPEATPAASPVADTTATAIVTTLYTHELPDFPAAPVSVRLLRMTLEPGASSPMHLHPGPELDYVVSGALTVNTQGEATVVGANGNEVTRVLGSDILTPGDLVVFPAGVGMNLINDGSESLVLLSAVFHPITEEGLSTTYPDGNPSADAFAGLSYEVLGDGQIQTFPTGATTFSLDDILMPPAADLPGQEGATLCSQVSGDFAFAVVSGSVQVSRTASPGLRPNAAPEQEFTLAPGDAAVFPAGLVAASRADQTSDLSVLRLSAVPSEALTLEPASIAFLPPAAVPEDEEPGEELTEIGIGATVVTTLGDVNLRAEPSTSANSLLQLAEGVELTVIGGPEEADGFTWWQVQGTVGESPVEGWLAEDFLAFVGGAAQATETPEAEETPDAETVPEASPSASPVADGEFAEGQIVALTDDNVRVRPEATVNSEPVGIFLLGTEFEITGAPVEGDGYLWYPVLWVADPSVTGWVAEDFLEAVPDED